MSDVEPSGAAAAPIAVPQVVLEDGEVIILAIKPSSWSVLLAAGGVLGVAAVVAVATYFTGDLLGPAARNTVLLVCMVVAALAVLVASAQWVGRLYVLTNLRVMRIWGVFGVELLEAPLNRIVASEIVATTPQRWLGLGNLLFRQADGELSDVSWIDVRRLGRIKQAVDEAIRRRHANGR
jgi:hypothetical protein